MVTGVLERQQEATLRSRSRRQGYIRALIPQKTRAGGQPALHPPSHRNARTPVTGIRHRAAAAPARQPPAAPHQNSHRSATAPRRTGLYPNARNLRKSALPFSGDRCWSGSFAAGKAVPGERRGYSLAVTGRAAAAPAGHRNARHVRHVRT